jgi:hypothetical protein
VEYFTQIRVDKYLISVDTAGRYSTPRVFTVFYSGYIPRCALEIYNSGQVRIEKIFKLIENCQLGIHDISRTELDVESKLPRFNMPLELGMFLGAQRFGAGRHKNKNCLILDRETEENRTCRSSAAMKPCSRVLRHAG